MRRRAFLLSGLLFALAMNGEAMARGGAANRNATDDDKPEKKEAQPKQKQKVTQADKNRPKPKPLTDKEKAELKEKAAQHMAELKEKKNSEDKGQPLQHFHTASHSSHSSRFKSDSNWLGDKSQSGSRSPTDKLFN